jgi:hypothetical protein
MAEKMANISILLLIPTMLAVMGIVGLITWMILKLVIKIFDRKIEKVSKAINEIIEDINYQQTEGRSEMNEYYKNKYFEVKKNAEQKM